MRNHSFTPPGRDLRLLCVKSRTETVVKSTQLTRDTGRQIAKVCHLPLSEVRFASANRGHRNRETLRSGVKSWA